MLQACFPPGFGGLRIRVWGVVGLGFGVVGVGFGGWSVGLRGRGQVRVDTCARCRPESTDMCGHVGIMCGHVGICAVTGGVNRPATLQLSRYLPYTLPPLHFSSPNPTPSTLNSQAISRRRPIIDCEH
eukprot:1821983-Rhodomonas_salina.1